MASSMGSMQDAMLRSGLASEEQIKSAQREKDEKERLDKERSEAREVERRERQLERSLPDFIKQAIKERREQVELYVERAEKQFGQLPWRIRGKLLKLNPFDALLVLGTALTLHGITMMVAEGKDEKEHDRIVKLARQRALDTIYEAFRGGES